MESKPNLVLLSVLAVLTIAAVAFAGFGWWQHEHDWTDALYLALRSTDGGVKYEEIGEQIKRHVVALEIGRFLGVFVEPLAFIVVFVSLFSKTLIGLRARWLHSKHIVVVGKSVFADKLSEYDQRRHGQGQDSRQIRVVHLRGIDDEAYARGHAIRLPFASMDAQGLHAGGAAKAAGIVIAPENDAQAIDLGMAALRLFSKAQVTVRLNDFWLAERLYDTPGGGFLRAVSEPCLAARFIVRCHPPYLLARDLGHARIHTLLVGDHDWLEALMTETILSARTLSFDKPLFSFICREPEAFLDRLNRRYPAIAGQAELRAYAAHPLEKIDVFSNDLADIAGMAPITGAYCLFSEGAQSMSNAQAFLSVAREVADFKAPVFVRNGGHAGERPLPGSVLNPLQIVPFGDMADMAAASGVLAEKTDIAERSLHTAYIQIAEPTKDAATAWETAREEYRVSNRRAISHMFAKLFEAGFDLRAWMEVHDIWKDLPALVTGERLYRDDEELEKLMVLEHERWIADRCMSGWQYGTPRDPIRKRHENMQPFIALSPKIQSFDRVSIEALEVLLKPEDGGLHRL